jgi:HAD superfamily hydrolase (TIGR01509 family)
MPVTSADALLFDLGRVVIDIDFDRAFARWAAHAGCDRRLIEKRFAERFRQDTSYRRHETGDLDTSEYFAVLRSRFEIEISDEQFLDGWNAIFVGEMPGISDLLVRAARQVPLYAFTNTNREHERVWSQRFAGVLGNFKEIYVSSTIGLRKPDAAAYDHVVKAIGVPAERIVFFDDVLENVAGARARGLQAVHVRSSADVAAALKALSI